MTEFDSILFKIYEMRKDNFDRRLKQFLTPVEIIFEEEDDFEILLSHFNAILKIR
jgi:hypothetical protein